MMRYWITLLLLGVFATFVFGQPLGDLGKRLKHLEKQSEFKFDTTGLSVLPKFHYRCANTSTGSSPYLHVADLNQDGLNDLIYSGPCASGSHTGIFLNTGRVFRRAYDFPGKIVSIERGEANTIINVLKEAIACEDYSQYIELTIDLKSRITKNTILFGPATKITVRGSLRQEKVVGTLRTSPQVNDEIRKNDCKTAVRRGNQLTRIEEFKDIVQLNRLGEWWLVLYQENSEKSWIGWMRLN